MAISPKDLINTINIEIDKYEELIDEILIERGKTSDSYSICFDYPSGMSNNVFNKLKTRYLNAGWSNIKTDNHRNETYITFYF